MPHILDEFVLVPARLPTTGQGKSAAQSLAVRVRAAGREVGTPLGLPVLLRTTSKVATGDDWGKLCKLLSRLRIPLFSGVAEMENLDAASVPARFGGRVIDDPLLPEELKTADAFEIECYDRAADRWAWPREAVVPQGLKNFVNSVRMAGGGDVPVGLSIPSGLPSEDLETAIESTVDFLTVSEAGEALTPLTIRSISEIRKLTQIGDRQPVQIVLDVPLDGPEQIAKLIALGADIVCVDRLIAPLLERPKPSKATASGMLSGIATPASNQKSVITDVERVFDQIREDFANQLRRCGVTSVADLKRGRLRATTDAAARMAQVELL